MARNTNADRVSQGDVNLAKQTISRRDDLPDEWSEKLSTERYDGPRDELSDIRSAMRDYEKNEAEAWQEKSYYDARLVLQYLPTADDE